MKRTLATARKVPTIAALGLAFQILAPMPTHAEDGASPSRACPLLLAEARFELEDRREAEDLAPIRSKASQAIFDLIEPLWKARSTEWLRYLGAKHARDRARLEIDLAKLQTARAEEKLALLTRECLDPKSNVENPARRFEELGCDVVRKTREIAALDLAYRKEVLESTNELRRLELATAQDLIHARHTLDRARAQLRSRDARSRLCNGSPGARP